METREMTNTDTESDGGEDDEGLGLDTIFTVSFAKIMFSIYIVFDDLIPPHAGQRNLFIHHRPNRRLQFTKTSPASRRIIAITITINTTTTTTTTIMIRI